MGEEFTLGSFFSVGREGEVICFEKVVSFCPQRKWVKGESLFLLCCLGYLVLKGGGSCYCWAIKAISRRIRKRKKKKRIKK